MIYYNTQSYTANRRPITDTDNMDAVDGGSVIGCGECEIAGMNDAKAENTSESHDTLLMKADSERTPEMFDNRKYCSYKDTGVENISNGHDQSDKMIKLDMEDDTRTWFDTQFQFDGKTIRELILGYGRLIETMHHNRTTVPRRKWINSNTIRAVGALLTDKFRKYWLGPTLGDTCMARANHRKQKNRFTSMVFKYTLSYISQDLAATDDHRSIHLLDKLTNTCKVRMGGGQDKEESLFMQYVARLEQLPREETLGHTLYEPKHRTEFEKLSRKRQLLEIGKLGVKLDSMDSATKLFVRDDRQYSTIYTPYEVPAIFPVSMTTADILHHRYHLTAKVDRLRKLRRESKREATIALRRRRRAQEARTDGRDWSIGAQRAKNIYLINRSLVEHNKLLQQLQVQLRKRMQSHNKTLGSRYVGDVNDTMDVNTLSERTTTRTRRDRGCRHHIKPRTQAADLGDEGADKVTEDVQKPTTFLQEIRRYRLRKWETRSQKVVYRSAQDRVGGFLSAQCEKYGQEEGTISVCSLNVRGFDDNDITLELVLQFMQDEDIDVMVCIDAQLDEKKGHWYGKIAKRRLGVGTRTNVNPCMIEPGSGSNSIKQRVGGIFTIVGPKWGTSLVNFQKDKFGCNEGSAGVMTQVTLSTVTSKLNIIGTYWPNRNVSSDSTLWNTLNRYVHNHRLRDNNPIELLQRVSQQWIATAYKNGARGSILCGDLNATWTGQEAGGQTILQHWAEAFSLHNGVRQAAQKLHCEMFTRGGDGQPRTWIDHILHKGMSENIQCLAGYTSQASEWVGITDHWPIWGVYHVHPPLQRCPKTPRVQKVRYELHLTDRQKCDEFTEAMETLLEIPTPTDESSDEEVIAYMHKIEQHSATTVKHLHNAHGQTRQRSSRKDGWSPMYIAYKAQLTALVEIRRSILGHANRAKWTDHMTMMHDLPDVLEMWEATLDGLDISNTQRIEIDSVPHSLQWWKNITAIPQIGLVDDDIDKIKQLLHGTSRTEMRRRINVHIRRREDARREGKWKRVIGSLLGNLAGRRHQPGIDLDMITTDGTKILGEPEEIHQAVTDKFEEWFDIPNECQGDLHVGNNWRQCRDSEDYFVQDTSHTGAPEEIRRLIHRAIVQVPNRQRMHDEMRDILQQPPTLVEFEDAIQKAKTNSAAGISGCSYNQLKRWPPELIQRVHYCLCRIWRAQSTPEKWTARWLVVIPKKQEEIPNVNNMRPLILVEAIRKIWCKLLLHRILSVWGKYNALHRYQHGFIRGRNTMTASALFINTLEDAIEKGQSLHTCTWDITKAFDSVSKNVMKLAWTRLGVPDDWVQWLVGMDEKGTTTVRTPHAIDIWNKQGAAGLNRRTRKRINRGSNVFERFRCPGTSSPDVMNDEQQDVSGPGFHAVRGTGQGDVTSPTCWAAIFDILLTALHMDIQAKRSSCYVASDANRGYEEGETAYADDLLSCARTPEALQRKADIVSTFCLIMGLQISTSKLRRFVLAHSGLEVEGNMTTIVHQYGGRETVEGPQWEPTDISATLDGTLEYLGGKYDSDGSARSVLDEIKYIANSHCAEIGNTAASAVTKVRCLSMTTYAKIRYRSKLASTYLNELDQVDRIFHKFHTRTTKNMGSFPYDLLYLSPKYGGVGIQRYTDLNSIDKLSEMYRSLQRSDEVRMAMGGMLQRMARAQGHEINQGYRYRYRPQRGQRCWLRSALEWLQRHNIHLWRGGAQPNGDLLSSPINMALTELSTRQRRSLIDKGIIHIGDIVDDRGGYREWSVPQNMRWLLDMLPESPPTDNGSVLWPGQYWQPYVNIEGVRPAHVLEVVHVLDDQRVEVAIWRQNQRKGDRIEYRRDENNVTVTIDHMFGGPHTERWDQYCRKGNTCYFQRPRILPSPRATVNIPDTVPNWIQQAEQFCQDQGPDYIPRIYTDGSYVERDHDIHSVFEPDAVTKTAAAGIAIIHDGPDWRDRPIYAMHVDHGDDIGVRSAYTMEYLALAIAMRIQSQSVRASAVCTDSMAVLKRLRNRHVRLGKADESHRLLLQSISTSLAGGATVPQWVPSHPERRKKDQTSWTLDDWGNHIVDKIAGNSRHQLGSLHDDIRWSRISVIDVINSLPRQTEYYFGDIHGRPTALFGLMDHIHRTRLERYVTSRDSQREGNPKWMDNTIVFAASVFNEHRGTVGQHAHTARVIWDKHWHGRNRAKQRGLTDDGRQAASVCHMCNATDSQHHSFRWCSHSNVRAIREETIEALENYKRLHEDRRAEDGTEDDHRLQLAFIEGVIHEFHTCPDAGRVWTGNWSSGMITRLQTSMQMERITKKQCRSLHSILQSIYAIIAQGANDINDVRHGVCVAQESHGRRVQNTRTASDRMRDQASILDFLLDTRGRTGMEKRAIQELETEEEEVNDEMNMSVHSDYSLEHNEHWESDMESDDWLQYPKAEECQKISSAIHGAEHKHQCLTQVGKYTINANSLQRLITGGEIDTAVVDGYMHMLEERHSGLKCMGSSFFGKLYNPGGHIRHMPRDTFNMGYASHHFNRLDITQYRLVLVPILVKRHWCLIVIDMEAQQIRYLNPQGGEEPVYLTVIKRWLTIRWGSPQDSRLSFDKWRCLTTQEAFVPQQTDDTSCGIFLLMFSELIATGRDITLFHQAQCHKARMIIAHCLLNFPTRNRQLGCYDCGKTRRSDSTSEQQTHSTGSITKKRKTRASLALRDTSSIDLAIDTPQFNLLDQVPVANVSATDTNMASVATNRQDSLDTDSLAPGGWLTDGVINAYFQLLHQRSCATGNNNAFLSAHFYNRLYDPDTKGIRTHLQHRSDADRNIHGLTELDELRAMHQHDALLNYSHVFLPVPLSQHWGLLDIDNGTRTITFLDSFNNGGLHYARIMSDYLTQYEEEITGSNGPVWSLRCTVNPNCKPITPRLVCVPRQQNGNDCGVFVCLFADLLDRQHDIMQYQHPDIDDIRSRIRRSLLDQMALALTGSDGGLQDRSLHTQVFQAGSGEDMTVDAMEHDSSDHYQGTNDNSTPIHMSVTIDSAAGEATIHLAKDLQGENKSMHGIEYTPIPADSCQGTRRSTRSTRHTGSMAEVETAIDINYHRLAVRKVDGMGWGLFVTTAFSHSERVICTYHGKRITARQAKAKSNKSRYIVELPGKTKYNYIDGYDPATERCYSAGPYANDGINWTGRRDLWNAELAIDDYNPELFVLRPLRDIQAGEQIYVWYGPRYWCSDDHPLDQLVMAVMTYGINITTSTERPNSYGNWTKLKHYQALLDVLKQHGYVPPPTIADIKSIREVPRELHGSILEATAEVMNLYTLPTLQPVRRSQHDHSPMVATMIADSTAPSDQVPDDEDHAPASSVLSIDNIPQFHVGCHHIAGRNPPVSHMAVLDKPTEVVSDEDQLPPSPVFTKRVIPRFRVGHDPIASRKSLLHQVKARVTSKFNHLSGRTKRNHAQVADVDTPVDTMPKRRRLEDMDVTAPDADDAALDLSLETQTDVNIKDTNIRGAKRTFSQATLPDGYWTKRPRMDSRSS